MTPVGFDRVTFSDGFWQKIRAQNAAISIKNVYRRFEETGRFAALRCQKQKEPPHIFYDSDVAKWLEGAAYLQREFPDEEVRSIIDEAVNAIVENQLPCGYFNSYFQVYEPDKIFTRRTEHELYCAGHLIEAAVALDVCGVNGRLLAAMRKYTDYIYLRFYVRRDAGFTTCGHPEIELALVRLYLHTGEKRYLTLAKFFLDERGVREEEIYPFADRAYDQSHMPVRMQREAAGHAVRALYLYSAMADVGRIAGDEQLIDTCRALYRDVADKKLYVTGGVGSGWFGERFTIPYDLPNADAYAETCAAIALALFCHRLAQTDNRAEYHATLERALYNNVLAAESANGKGFFYENPLEADARYAKYANAIPGFPHKPLLQRAEVFGCSCCPPNLVRFFAQLGGFVYGEDNGVLTVNQYVSSQVSACGIHLSVQTDIPFSGNVDIRADGRGTLSLRLPAWRTFTQCEVDGKHVVLREKDDYAYFEVAGSVHIKLVFGMRPRFVYANERVRADSGRKAVEYGPLVMCAEQADNGGELFSVEIPSLENAVVSCGKDFKILVPALRLRTESSLYGYSAPQRQPFTLTLIPYYRWANRGENDMQIWFL